MQELPDKLQISGKRYRIFLLEIEKKESKKLKRQISQSPQYNQIRQSQSRRGNVYMETDQDLGISGNAGTTPKYSF